MDQVSCEWDDRQGQRWIRLGGELDHQGCTDVAPRFRSALELEHPEVVVDMEAVTFLASQGIRLLLEARHRIAEQGGTMHVCHLRAHIRKTLELIGTLEVIPELPDGRE